MSNSPARGAARLAATEIPNFDRLAAIYRWMEWLSFGPWLWRCRCAFLNQLQDRRRALILGDGDGRFTARLLASNATVRVDAVDGSPAMLRQLLRHAEPNRGRVQIHRADIRDWEPPARGYDLIVTHFFLDCLSTPEVEALAKRILSHAGPGSAWVVSEFDIPSGGVPRLLAPPLITLLYGAFALITGLKTRSLPDHRKALIESGFILKGQQKWLWGILVSELWSLPPYSVSTMLQMC